MAAFFQSGEGFENSGAAIPNVAADSIERENSRAAAVVLNPTAGNAELLGKLFFGESDAIEIAGGFFDRHEGDSKIEVEFDLPRTANRLDSITTGRLPGS